MTPIELQKLSTPFHVKDTIQRGHGRGETFLKNISALGNMLSSRLKLSIIWQLSTQATVPISRPKSRTRLYLYLLLLADWRRVDVLKSNIGAPATALF